MIRSRTEDLRGPQGLKIIVQRQSQNRRLRRSKVSRSREPENLSGVIGNETFGFLSDKFETT